MKGERTVEKRRERNTKKTLLDIYSKYGIILILILIMAFLTIRTGGTFIGKNNLLNILKQIACIGVLACGQTAVIIAGGMDLSVGSIVSLVSVLVASTAHPGDFPLIVPIMVGLLTGLVCGLINGLAVAKLKIPPFIVTMSTMTIFAGIALLITKGTPINHFSDAFNFIGGGKLLAAGSACPFHPGSYLTPETDTYYGEALAVGEAGESGAVEVSISDGERSDTVKIPIA